MTENINDPYLERYRELRKVALAKGLDLRYIRRRANLVNVLLGEVDCELGAWTGEERLELVDANSDERFFIWISSEADAATVFQEATDYLELPSPDDPGIARAACAQEYNQGMAEQIVALAKEVCEALPDGERQKEEP